MAAVDTTALVSGIAEQAVPVVAVGAAFLLVLVGIEAFKWVRQSIEDADPEH